MFIIIKKNDSLDDKVEDSYILIKVEDIINVEDPSDWDDSDGACYTILRMRENGKERVIPIAESAKQVSKTIERKLQAAESGLAAARAEAERLRMSHPVRVVEESETTHRWDRDGERCLKCNGKDWMDGPCNTTDEEYIARLTAERDAALRERDAALYRLDGAMGCVRLNNDRASVAELKAERDAARAECERLRGKVATMEEERRWISVAQRPPDDGATVFASDGDAVAEVRYFLGYGFERLGGDELSFSPTHWMPLPAPPKGGEVEE